MGSAPTVVVPTTPPPKHLEIRNIVLGHGAVATSRDTVTVQYVGLDYANGKVFNSSWTSGGPVAFPLTGVIPGFAEGIVGMRVGGRREIVIPPSLGYGATGRPPVIAPDETLLFVIDLLKVS